MDFLPENISDYANLHTEVEADLLAKIDRETHMHVLLPRMLSGSMQGRVLSMFSHLIQPKRILEIGTYTGYSALCLAEGLSEDGEIHTIDINEELVDFQRKYFDASGFVFLRKEIRTMFFLALSIALRIASGTSRAVP